MVLAAGRGARLGRPKQLLPLAGRPLLQHVVDAAAAGGLEQTVVVLGHAAEEIARALRLPPGARLAVNADYELGQPASLRAGLAAASPGVDAALVLLGDQPEVRPEAIRAVAAAHAPAGPLVVRASYGGRPAHPVLLHRRVWADLELLRGDEGARAVMTLHAGRAELVEVGGTPPEDVDDWAAYRRVLARRERRGR